MPSTIMIRLDSHQCTSNQLAHELNQLVVCTRSVWTWVISGDGWLDVPTLSSDRTLGCYSQGVKQGRSLSSDGTLGNYLRKNVARDDIVDALVAAVAGCVSQGKMINISEPPEIDTTGLPMRMAIPSFT